MTGADLTRRSLLRTGVAGIGVAATGDTAAGSYQNSTASNSWPMAHRDATNTSAALGTTGPVRDLSPEWMYSVDGPVHSPVVSDGRVFVGSSDGVGSVVALDAASGEQLWRTPLDIGTQTAPAVVDDTVVVVTRDGRMYGLSVETGDTRWSYYELQVASDERIKYAPTVAGSTVYVVCPTDDISGAVHAVDSSDGSQQWVYRTDRWYPNGTPAVGEEMVYAGFDDRLVALETTTGTERWHYDTAGVVSTPMVYDGTVYAGANGNVYRFDSTTGELVWRNTQGFAVDSALATGDKRVYYLDSGQLVAIGHDGSGGGRSTSAMGSPPRHLLLPATTCTCGYPPPMRSVRSLPTMGVKSGPTVSAQRTTVRGHLSPRPPHSSERRCTLEAEVVPSGRSAGPNPTPPRHRRRALALNRRITVVMVLRSCNSRINRRFRL